MRMSMRKGLSHSFKKSRLTSDQFSAVSRLECLNRLRNINGVSSADWSNPQLGNRSCHVVLFHFRFPSGVIEERQALLHSITQSLQTRIRKHFDESDTFQIEADRIVTVFYGSTREPIVSFMHALKPMMKADPIGCYVTIAIGTQSFRYNELGAAYQQVLEMTMQANLSEQIQVIEKRTTTPPILLSPKHEQALGSFMQAGNAQGAMQLVSQLMDQFVKSESTLQAYRHLAYLVAAKAWVILEPLHLKDEAAGQVYSIIKQLEACGTVPDYIGAFTALFEMVASLIQDAQKQHDPIAKLVMDILNTRYAQDLSLVYLAQLLNMSPAYLSVFIKEKTGANFSDHLNEIRVRKAKELLVVTEMSIQEISMQVGYANLTSFNRMFKKQTGMAPGEFRKQQISEIHKVNK